MSTFSVRDFALGVVVGVVAPLLLGSAVVVAVLRASDIYSLGHWKLNVRTPIKSMWMNLGYWTTPDGEPVEHFDDACLGLLREILQTAGLLPCGTDGTPATESRPPISVLDVGFGCGDQTLALARLLQPRAASDFRYVGLTLNASQLQAASRAIHDKFPSPSVDGTALDETCFRVFRADAAKPETWSPPIRAAVEELADGRFDEKWLLALDCLYHFSPSRKPLFLYASETLGANLMAFDLVLDEKAGWRRTMLVRALGFVLSCPFGTFLTEQQYRRQLVECGYDADEMTLRDISDDVFSGIARYLERQERALGRYGISIGGYKLTGRVFDWFHASRVVKAVVVVGRTGTKQSSGASS
ncbi:hypothetical protein RJ55_01979 [Drechmeria coniospora]|nr:hypothetical protein RJ55_01979 [Drechmeria coniospora]